MSALFAVAALGLPCAARAQGLSLDTSFQAPVFTLSGVQPQRCLVLPNSQFLVYSGYTNIFGGFDRYNSVTTGGLLRFNADGSLDTTFALDPSLYAKAVNCVAAMANGQYIITTNFVSRSGNTSQVYRLNTNGSVDGTFNTGAGTNTNGLFRDVAVQTDGKVIAGGNGVTQYNGTPVTDIVRLNTDGSVDTTFNVTLGFDASGSLAPIDEDGFLEDTGIQFQTDGKIILAGGFTSVDGVTRPDVVRLNTDGSLDTSFVPSGYTISEATFNDLSYPTRTAAVQTDGKIIVGGRFNVQAISQTAQISQTVIRLNTDGSLDTTFNAPFAPRLDAGFVLRLTPDGSVVVGTATGAFTEYNADGTVNAAFANNLPDLTDTALVSGLGVFPNGQLLVTGGLDTTNPAVASGIARLNADGTLDTSVRFTAPQADSAPLHLAVRPDGTILASGAFDTVAGQSRAGLALLNANGSLNAATLPSSFLAGYNFSDGLYEGLYEPSFVLQSDDNKIFLFGNLPPPDGNSGPGFTYLRLNADLSVDTTLKADASVTPFENALYQPGSGYLLSSGSPDASYISVTNGYSGDPGFFLQRLSLQGTPDSSFVPAIDTTTIYNGTGPDNVDESTLYAGNDAAVVVQPDGKILFQYFDDTEAYRLIRLNADGSLDSGFQIGSAPPTSAVGTGFASAMTSGGQAMEVYTESGGIAGAFVQSDGRILIYGDFATYNGQRANGFARLNTNGTLDTGFNTGTGPQGPGGAVGTAYAVTNAQELSNGQLLVVGSFTTFNGVARPGLARLNADGSVDTSFTAAGVVNQQTSFGPIGFGNGSSTLTPVGNGTYLLTGNYTNTRGAGAGTFFRLFGGVSTTPTPVAPVVPSNLPSFFNGAVALSGGFYYLTLPGGNVFGYYDLDFYPYLYHSDLGFEYVIDADDGKGGIYLYDFASQTFFYTSPSFPFPYLYDFTLKAVLYYFPDTSRPGRYTSNPRYFYNFATGKIITK